jgi:hypothetical protein
VFYLVTVSLFLIELLLTYQEKRSFNEFSQENVYVDVKLKRKDGRLSLSRKTGENEKRRHEP